MLSLSVQTYRTLWEMIDGFVAPYDNNFLVTLLDGAIDRVVHEYAAALRACAKKYGQRGQFAKALDCYNQLANLDIDDFVYFDIGTCLFHLRKYQDALNQFQYIEDLAEQKSDILIQIAKCYNKLGDTETASEYLQRAATFDPNKRLSLLTAINRLRHSARLFASTTDLAALEEETMDNANETELTQSSSSLVR